MFWINNIAELSTQPNVSHFVAGLFDGKQLNFGFNQKNNCFSVKQDLNLFRFTSISLFEVSIDVFFWQTLFIPGWNFNFGQMNSLL